MRIPDEKILSDLGSKNPERIGAGLRALQERLYEMDEFELVPFGVEIFEPFGAAIPEQVWLDFLTVLRNYRSFNPELSEERKIAEMIGLMLRYAEHYMAFEVAMKLRISKDPVKAVKAGMQQIVHHGLRSPRNIQGAQWLVSYLLDGAEVRRATLEVLREWPDEEAFREVVRYVEPQLEPDEAEFLRTERSGGVDPL